jgi:acyl-CoA thioester hydrolase
VRVYRLDLTVPDEAVDENAHVNNVEYIRWMEEAARAHAAHQGSTAAAQAIGATWYARAIRVEYLRPAFAGEHLAILTWVADFHKVRSLRRYRIFRVTDGVLLAEGETDWVFVDAATGRPRSIPPEVTRLFEVVPEDEAPQSLAGVAPARSL